MKVHGKSINYFWRTRLRFTLLLSRMGTFRMLLFTTLTSRSGTTSAALWFVTMFPVLWIAADTTTNFTACWWQFCLSHILRNLANARFTRFRKSFHAIFTATISCLELFLFFLFGLFFLILWTILRIFTSEDKIFFRTTTTTTCLTTLISEMSPSLISWHNTNTSFLMSVSVSMFTFFATIFIPYWSLTFLFHGLFWGNTITNIGFIFFILLFLCLFDAFIFPFLIIRWTAATWDGSWGGWRRWWSWFSFWLLCLLSFLIFSQWEISDSLISDILKKRIGVIIFSELLLLLLWSLLILVLIVPIWGILIACKITHILI